MTNIQEIENALYHAKSGTRVEIDGYHDSEGNVTDLKVELLPPDAYATMQNEDLALLRDADVATLFGDGLGDLQLTDLIAAREQLIAAREKAIRQREEGGSAYKGAEYTSITDSMGKLPGQNDTLYLMRMQTLKIPTEPKPAKGAIPRAKQKLARQLNLPTIWYIHTLKLEPGKFTDLRIVR
jgi:hypothetical protein